MHLQIHFLLPYPAQCWRRLISAILQQALFSTGWLVGQWEVLEAGRMGSWLPSSTPTLSFPSSLPCSGELQPSVRPQIPPCSLLPTTASSMFLPCRSGVVTAPILASLRLLFKVFKVNNCVYVPSTLFILSKVFSILYWSLVD